MKQALKLEKNERSSNSSDSHSQDISDLGGSVYNLYESIDERVQRTADHSPYVLLGAALGTGFILGLRGVGGRVGRLALRYGTRVALETLFTRNSV